MYSLTFVIYIKPDVTYVPLGLSVSSQYRVVGLFQTVRLRVARARGKTPDAAFCSTLYQGMRE